MSTPINPPTKPTALQEWNWLLRKKLDEQLLIKFRPDSRNRNPLYPLRKYLEKAQAAILIAEQFEVTKHRTIVDELIRQFQKGNQTVSELPWYRFGAKMRARVIASTFQVALMIVVNTYPPIQPTKQNSK